jgi:putative DNA-binding phage protein
MKLTQFEKEELGTRIKNIRLNKGMTTKEFGSLLGATDSNITSWEKGRTSPNPERLKTIAKIADTSVNTLLYGEMRRRIAKIVSLTAKTNPKFNSIDVRGVTRRIYHALPSMDYTNKELEEFIIHELETLFVNGVPQELTKSNPTDFSDMVKFYTKEIMTLLERKQAYMMQHEKDSVKLDLLNEMINIQQDFISKLTQYTNTK